MAPGDFRQCVGCGCMMEPGNGILCEECTWQGKHARLIRIAGFNPLRLQIPRAREFRGDVTILFPLDAARRLARLTISLPQPVSRDRIEEMLRAIEPGLERLYAHMQTVAIADALFSRPTARPGED